jgi:beta-N-acetylhexosaminidase
MFDQAISYVADLTIEQKIGQMVMAQAFGRFRSIEAAEYKALHNLVVEHHIGGFKLYHGYALGTALLLRHLECASTTPLLVAADLEEGVGQQIADAPRFPPMAALGAAGDPELARHAGRLIAQEVLRLGVNTLFAPLLDLHTAADTYFGVRCLGADPGEVRSLGMAFVQGVHEAGALSVAKYFPGHGRQAFQPDGSTLVDVKKDQLSAADWAPFRQAITQDVDAVMVSHGAFPALDPTPWGSEAGTIPASLSRRIVTDILRHELGFDGIVITDALNLPFLTREHTMREIARRAVVAGVDILVALSTVQDAIDAVRGIRDALEMELITEAQVDHSVTRIMAAKRRTRAERLDSGLGMAQDTALGTDETIHLIEEIAARSVCLLIAPEAGFPIKQRPIQLPVVVIGRCQAREQIQADPWQPWHAGRLPQDVSFTVLEVEPKGDAFHETLQGIVGSVTIVILLEPGDEAVQTLQVCVRVLRTRGIRPILILPLAPRLARRLAPLGWASLWTADMRQASRLAALAVLLGQAAPLGKLPLSD